MGSSGGEESLQISSGQACACCHRAVLSVMEMSSTQAQGSWVKPVPGLMLLLTTCRIRRLKMQNFFFFFFELGEGSLA